MDRQQLAQWANGHPELSRPSYYDRISPLAITTSIVATAANLRSAYRITELTLALELYRSGHGEYPPSLAALAPQYLDKVDPDPATNRDFGYLRDDADYWLFRGPAGPDGHPRDPRDTIHKPEKRAPDAKSP
jgi:hypothetical protein